MTAAAMIASANGCAAITGALTDPYPFRGRNHEILSAAKPQKGAAERNRGIGGIRGKKTGLESVFRLLRVFRGFSE